MLVADVPILLMAPNRDIVSGLQMYRLSLWLQTETFYLGFRCLDPHYGSILGPLICVADV